MLNSQALFPGWETSMYSQQSQEKGFKEACSNFHTDSCECKETVLTTAITRVCPPVIL